MPKPLAIGDLVSTVHAHLGPKPVGIVVEVIRGQSVPPVCKILWPSGSIEKEWTDDIEVVNEPSF